MHRKVVIVVAAALFLLQAVLAGIVTDLFDREFPVSLGARAQISADFSESTLTHDDALKRLTELDEDYHLGLVKVLPDLSRSGQRVYVPLQERKDAPAVEWFGSSATAEVAGVGRLANSDPGGTYLVTGDAARVAAVKDDLQASDAAIEITSASPVGELAFLLRDARFAAPLVATFALLAATALFWLSSRARGRAIRVLAGASGTQIVSADIGSFIGRVTVAAIGSGVVAALAVGVFRGWVYVAPFGSVFGSLVLVSLAVAGIVVLSLSTVAWPNIDVIASRKAAVTGLRRIAAVTQAATFVLLLGTAGPTWSALNDASERAKELSSWGSLSDYVSLVFAMPQQDLESVEPVVGRVLSEGEKTQSVAFSYTFDEATFQGNFDGYDAVSIVNAQWLSLMSASGDEGELRDADTPEARRMLSKELGPTLDLLKGDKGTDGATFADARLLQPKPGVHFPLAVGGSRGQLEFEDNALVVVVPKASALLDASSATSMASTGNLLFNGVERTQQSLAASGGSTSDLAALGVEGTIQTIYIAEAGLLEAQYATYVVWLLILSMIALVVAFAVAAAVNALIVALLAAKRDFPLRLSGGTWTAVTAVRVLRAATVGLVLLVTVLLIQRPEAYTATLLTAAFALAALIVSNTIAVRWCFSKIVSRKL